MNFFQHQDTARRNTRWLVVFFLLAILSLIVITTVAVVITWYFLQFNSTTAISAMDSNSSMMQAAWGMVTPELIGAITFGVVGIVAIGSLYKFAQLKGGGRKVAEALGGRLIPQDSGDYDERKILNVVEEMAIAAGTPVPPVYIMEDRSINAFAAGFHPQDAVIGITRGCIHLLNREELQGVIAHEFSHILHGDMRLNIRLIGVLHGILSLGLIGYFLFRSGAYSGIGRSRKGNSAGAIIFLGGALIVVGYAGTFFGNIIKAAVSRQREFLADASAVQFTRNPDGISGALKKIGGYPSGSTLNAPSASEFSHMYFGEGVVSNFRSLMATHPPLPERIRRIEPNWRGKYPNVDFNHPPQETEEGVSHFQQGGHTVNTSANDVVNDTVSTVDSIGQPSPAHVDYARTFIEQLDTDIREACKNPFSARAVIYCLLLDKNKTDIRNVQLQKLSQLADTKVFKVVQQLESVIQHLPVENVLPIVELALPSLKQLAPQQYHNFKKNVVGLIKADKIVSLFEWSLYRILVHNLESQTFGKTNYSLAKCADSCRVLLSILAHAGHSNPDIAKAAYQKGFDRLAIGSRFFIESSDIGLQELDQALAKLRQLKPLQKPTLLKALIECISFDNQITSTEAELFRAIADSLDCPVPPILPGQALA